MRSKSALLMAPPKKSSSSTVADDPKNRSIARRTEDFPVPLPPTIACAKLNALLRVGVRRQEAYSQCGARGDGLSGVFWRQHRGKEREGMDFESSARSGHRPPRPGWTSTLNVPEPSRPELHQSCDRWLLEHRMSRDRQGSNRQAGVTAFRFLLLRLRFRGQQVGLHCGSFPDSSLAGRGPVFPFFR